MDFLSTTWRNGGWVTETLSLSAVLNASQTTRPRRQPVQKSPACGILTKTVIESPVAHSILPVRLRSAQHIDVAFVGDHYVLIRELQRDGRLRDVIRKNDFGCRIRNARVIGTVPDDVKSEDDVGADTSIKVEDGDISMDDSLDVFGPDLVQRQALLPPQQLMLVLESGDCVFLFLHPGADGALEFVINCFPAPSVRFVHPGFHAAVDPSSRYMALACSEGLFVVYELASARSLEQSYTRGEPLNYVKSLRPRAVQGVIHKMEFLYPRPADDYHIILLLIVVKHGKSRMITYEWEAGDDLKAVFAEDKAGYRLPPEHQMPLLVIPLTVRTAFLAISPKSIAVCKDVLQGPPDFEKFQLERHETSKFHHGLGPPLWTAWTRPYRLSSYTAVRDNIYLAREDGVVMFLDIDSDNILGASVEIGKFECNVATAFCSLFDDFNDILIMGGDSGPGTIWQIRPRKPNVQLGSIPNWSPAVDFTTTDEFSTWNQAVGARGNRMTPWRERPFNTFSNPDRVFATSGRGVTGAVTEYRYGMQANVGLDVDYQVLLRQSWIFPNLADPSVGFHMLVSMLDRSTVLLLSEDLAQASELAPDMVDYDVSSRTIAAAQVSSHLIAQVTENFLVFVGVTQNIRCLHAELLREPEVTISDASIKEDRIALSAHVGAKFQIRLLRVTAEGTAEPVRRFDVDGEVTCLSLARINGVPCIMAGLFEDGRPSIVFLPTDGDQSAVPPTIRLEDVSFADYNAEDQSDKRRAPISFEALTSIISAPLDQDVAVLVLGTRGGEVLALTLAQTGEILAASTEKIGLTDASIACLEDPSLPKSVLICCDSKLVLMCSFDLKRATFRTKHRVWVTDAGDATKGSPPVTSVTVLEQGLPGHEGSAQLLLLAGTRALIAQIQPRAGPVQRSLPVKGTPTKIFYSHSLDCLVVAVTADNIPSLVFLDPDTGDDLSKPTDKDGRDVPYISGLGKPNDKIHGLREWEYRKDGDKWIFIVVTTEAGRLLIVSTSRLEATADGRRGKIRYWTRYKKTGFGDPVYSVMGDEENLVYCVGDSIEWDVLDVTEKKLKHMKSFQLNSSASTLRMINGKILALTTRDSLEIIDPKATGIASEASLDHVDSEARGAAHFIDIAGIGEAGVTAAAAASAADKMPAQASAAASASSIILVCDRACTVAGLWVPWQQPGRDCQVVFEAELPASVRKFRRGRTRPSWQQARRYARYGVLPSTADGAEVLGVCLDGSLQHFSFLSIGIWRVLRFVHNLAFASDTLRPFGYEPPEPGASPEPEADRSFGMQVDGDMLQNVLDRRALEALFQRPTDVVRLASLLDALDGGRWTADIRGGEGDDGSGTNEEDRERRYLELLYDILEYYLAPAM